MVPTGERQRLPARERWFWAGVGGVSALAIWLLGLALAATIADRSVQKRVVAHRSTPASARLKPAPKPSAAHPRKPVSRIVHTKPVEPRVRVVERPVKPPSKPSTTPAPKPGGPAAVESAGSAGLKPASPGTSP